LILLLSICCIGTSSHLFSGSSFYPGTWGFDLVGPENDDDIPDMEATIHNIDCEIANPDMIHTFVTQINPSIHHLEEMGCQIKKLKKANVNTYHVLTTNIVTGTV